MALRTRAYLAKRALFTGLSADGTLTGEVLVSYGFPRRDPPKRWLMVGRIMWADENWATLGPNRSREEDFSIALIANVQIDGGTENDVDVALEGVMGEVETFLRANLTLGIPGIWNVEFVPGKSQGFPVTDGGYEGQFEAQAVFKARI